MYIEKDTFLWTNLMYKSFSCSTLYFELIQELIIPSKEKYLGNLCTDYYPIGIIVISAANSRAKYMAK